MGEITDAFNTQFRDYNTDGVPSSGAYKPQKPGIRTIGALIDAAAGGRGALVPDMTGASDLSEVRETVQAIFDALEPGQFPVFFPGATYAMDRAPGQPYSILLRGNIWLDVCAYGAIFDPQGVPFAAGLGCTMFAYKGAVGGPPAGDLGTIMLRWRGGFLAPTDVGLDPVTDNPAGDFLWFAPMAAQVTIRDFHYHGNLATRSGQVRHVFVNAGYDGTSPTGRGMSITQCGFFSSFDTAVVLTHADSLTYHGNTHKFCGMSHDVVTSADTPWAAMGGNGVEFGQAGQRSFNGFALSGTINSPNVIGNGENCAGSAFKCINVDGGTYDVDGENNGLFGRDGQDATLDCCGLGTTGVGDRCPTIVRSNGSNSDGTMFATNFILPASAIIKGAISKSRTAKEIGIQLVGNPRSSNQSSAPLFAEETTFLSPGLGLKFITGCVQALKITGAGTGCTVATATWGTRGKAIGVIAGGIVTDWIIVNTDYNLGGAVGSPTATPPAVTITTDGTGVTATAVMSVGGIYTGGRRQTKFTELTVANGAAGVLAGNDPLFSLDGQSAIVFSAGLAAALDSTNPGTSTSLSIWLMDSTGAKITGTGSPGLITPPAGATSGKRNDRGTFVLNGTRRLVKAFSRFDDPTWTPGKLYGFGPVNLTGASQKLDGYVDYALCEDGNQIA